MLEPEIERQTKLDERIEYCLHEHQTLGRLERKLQHTQQFPEYQRGLNSRIWRANHDLEELNKLLQWIREPLPRGAAESEAVSKKMEGNPAHKPDLFDTPEASQTAERRFIDPSPGMITSMDTMTFGLKVLILMGDN